MGVLTIKELKPDEITMDLVKELRSKITALPWFTQAGKNAKSQLRMDIYSGVKPTFFERNLVEGKHNHVCHFHPVAESWAIYNGNTENDMSFLFHAPLIVDFLINRIKELESK